jgi:CHAT domain-containing protein
MQEPAAYDSAVAQLSRLLLPAGAVKKGEPRVEIAADGELTFVPFAALLSPSGPGERFSQTHTIAMVSSLLEKSGEGAVTSPRRWRLVAMQGTPRGGDGARMRGDSSAFPSLPGAAIEVNAIRSLFTPPEAVQVLEGTRLSIPEVRTALGEGADVMHFATHGLADVSHPLASLLSLPGGLLTAGQIQEWRGNVGLVFLSACETAVGPTRFAEGTPGLQRAFLRAGAVDVIATLWPVEDRLAAEFAQQFYVELTHGVGAAEALARTQRLWFSSANTMTAQKMMRRRVAAWGYVLYSR